MRIHRRNTYQSGADAMLVSHSWHSSIPLDEVAVGDIIRVKNRETLEAIDWKVTEPPVRLSPDEAKAEWENLKFFGTPKAAARHGYFPFILKNLELVKTYPPRRPSPRYIPPEIRAAVWLRDGKKCKYCGATEALELDHIIPVSVGGSNTENNIEVLCAPCNRRKSNKIALPPAP